MNFKSWLPDHKHTLGSQGYHLFVLTQVMPNWKEVKAKLDDMAEMYYLKLRDGELLWGCPKIGKNTLCGNNKFICYLSIYYICKADTQKSQKIGQ
ncbi:hypothetical protein [Catenovulum sediminis]|uniref:Uncharacterized protein n=1 Tax=Catenovulum sediminis TaxID=1740262 RepID=A0ABV1REI5_9ALTE